MQIVAESLERNQEAASEQADTVFRVHQGERRRRGASRWLVFAAGIAVGALLMLALLLVFHAVPVDAAEEGDMLVAVTYYLPTGNVAHNGQYPHWGTAGCSWNFADGTVIVFDTGLTVVCTDRGLDEFMVGPRYGNQGHVDVYCDQGEAFCLSTIPGVDNWHEAQHVTVIGGGG